MLVLVLCPKAWYSPQMTGIARQRHPRSAFSSTNRNRPHEREKIVVQLPRFEAKVEEIRLPKSIALGP